MKILALETSVRKTSALSVIGGGVMVERGRKAGSDRQGLEILILGNMIKLMEQELWEVNGVIDNYKSMKKCWLSNALHAC